MDKSGKGQPHTDTNSSDRGSMTPANTGTIYLVLIQVASRALTFAGNQFLLRYLSPTLLGLAVQLELVSITVLYTSRESLRVALQRQPAGDDQSPNGSRDQARTSSQQAINLAYLVLLVGLCASYIFGHGYLRHSGNEVLQSTDFWLAFRLYAMATFIELLAEPSFIVVQQKSMYKARAQAETGAAVARCLSACLTAIIMYSRHTPSSVLPFAVGQFCYAGTLFTLYLAAVIPVARREQFSLIPHKSIEAQTNSTSSNQWLGYFSKPLLTLTITFYAQSFFKLLLTQGDSFILSLVADLKSQGAFALASNYGGLLSRLLFQPVEESSRNIFGRLLVSDTSSSIDRDEKPNAKDDVSAPSVQSEASISRKTNIHAALTHLTTTLRLYTLFSLPILSLLPYILPPLIATVIGPRWSNPTTARLLSAYAYYLPFLALNGVLDAFVTSVASPRQLRTQSGIMLAVTILYGLLAWILINPPEWVTIGLIKYQYVGIGPSGLVYANIANMAMRISYSIWFIRLWIRNNVSEAQEWTSVWKKSLPEWKCVLVAVLVAGQLIVTIGQGTAQADSKKSFLGVKGLDLRDLGQLTGGIIVLGSSILTFERRFLWSVVSPFLPQRLKAMLKMG